MQSDLMHRTTFSISKELKKKLDSKPEINWPEIFKRGILQKLEQLERLQERGDL